MTDYFSNPEIPSYNRDELFLDAAEQEQRFAKMLTEYVNGTCNVPEPIIFIVNKELRVEAVPESKLDASHATLNKESDVMLNVQKDDDKRSDHGEGSPERNGTSRGQQSGNCNGKNKDISRKKSNPKFD